MYVHNGRWIQSISKLVQKALTEPDDEQFTFLLLKRAIQREPAIGKHGA